MALWHVEGLAGDVPRFRKPYPQPGWIADMRWNKRPLDWMRSAWRAFDICSKPKSERTDDDWQYIQKIFEDTWI